MKWILIALVSAQLWSQDFTQLPAWAREVAISASNEQSPAEVSAWVLLDRTEIAYTGQGQITIQRLRLVRVISEKALDEGTFILHGLGGKASKIININGWNLRPDGDLEQVSVSESATLSSAYSNTTGVSLPRMTSGSLVAWQSMQVIDSPMGPVAEVLPLENHPVRRWELELAKREGWFTNLKQVKVQMELRGFHPWISAPEVLAGQYVKVSNVPPCPQEETAHPDPRDMYPRVVVRFLDPELLNVPSLERGWDGIATWFHDRYSSTHEPLQGTLIGNPHERLQTIRGWMRERFVYKQFYLSPERGWIPEAPAEVARKRYGDCKDLAMFFVASARAAGLPAYPVLCRIVEGAIEDDEPLSPFAFNHVIAAVKIEGSFGLSSEIDTPQGRFLLVDLTERYQPLGQLGEAHAGRRMMLCLKSGALWIRVPTETTARPKVATRFHGTVNVLGRIQGTLEIQEIGNAFGLRSTVQEGDQDALKSYVLRNLIDLPPAATLEVVSHGQPLNVSLPFDVILKLDQPDGFRIRGSEGTIPGFFFPGIPSLIQKTGKHRRLPVRALQGPLITSEAEIRLPFPLEAVLPEFSLDSPLRRLSWNVKVMPTESGGSLIHWNLTNQRKAADFMFPDQEKGVQAVKQDRSALKRLNEDGLAFKVLPTTP